MQSIGKENMWRHWALIDVLQDLPLPRLVENLFEWLGGEIRDSVDEEEAIFEARSRMIGAGTVPAARVTQFAGDARRGQETE
jgi:hypothetical protein